MHPLEPLTLSPATVVITLGLIAGGESQLSVVIAYQGLSDFSEDGKRMIPPSLSALLPVMAYPSVWLFRKVRYLPGVCGCQGACTPVGVKLLPVDVEKDYVPFTHHDIFRSFLRVVHKILTKIFFQFLYTTQNRFLYRIHSDIFIPGNICITLSEIKVFVNAAALYRR